MNRIVSIERIGHRGEGLASIDGRRIFVPYALEGETVETAIDGDHASLMRIIKPSPERIDAVCSHFTRCGGCAVQTLNEGAYRRWKRELVEIALRNAGLAIDVAPVVDAHGQGRRRSVFHVRFPSGAPQVGFMAARSHDIVDIDGCPLLSPALAGALPAARAIAQVLRARAKPLDIAATATEGGLDIDIRGAGPLDEPENAALIEVAQTHDLARLTNHGRLIVLRRAPQIMVGSAQVTLPPGAFLQATAAGEEALAALVCGATKGAQRVADLFCGLGAFALRLATRAQVEACDSAGDAVAALQQAARKTSGLRAVKAQSRDLFKRPLTVTELADFVAVVFDPPRAGAEVQAKQLAASNVPLVIAVSCNAQTFSRDAAILIAGGYAARKITPVDQFRHAAHVEIVGIFERPRRPAGPKRRLLG